MPFTVMGRVSAVSDAHKKAVALKPEEAGAEVLAAGFFRVHLENPFGFKKPSAIKPCAGKGRAVGAPAPRGMGEIDKAVRRKFRMEGNVEKAALTMGENGRSAGDLCESSV